MVRSPFEFGASLPSYLTYASQTSGRVLVVFLLYEVSLSGSFTSVFTPMSWNITTDVLLFLFLVSTEGLIILLNVLASPRSFGNILARLLVFDRLVSGMFSLAWRLIHVQFCLAFAWPICLGIVRARAFVAFAVRGAFHEIGGTHLNFVRGVARAMPFP